MMNKRVTLGVLIISTLIVTIFIGFNVYTYAIPKAYDKEESKPGLIKTETVSIPVEGMTCFTCELTVSSALKRVDGVVSAKASTKDGMVLINYDPNKTDARQLIEAINNTGYKASSLE